MAAKQLDTLWDTSLAALSASYEKTQDLLDKNSAKEAAEEFHAHFLPVVKKLFTEAEKTYPPRFSKIDDWCTWIQNFYIRSAKADKALSDGSDPRKPLAAIREHLYQLHKLTATTAANDYAYALYVAAAAEKPSADDLRSLSTALASAKPSVKSKADAKAFAAASDDFQQQLDAILKDGSIADSELAPLRSATEKLYKGWGIQLE